MVKSKKKGSIIQLSSIYGIVGQDLSIYLGTDMEESMSYSIIKGGIINNENAYIYLVKKKNN